MVCLIVIADLMKLQQATADGNASVSRQLARELVQTVEHKMEFQDTYFVPFIKTLSEYKQVVLNTNILRELGLWNSRLHLVGMHLAIEEDAPQEKLLFQKEIPLLARVMVPRWKRLLYAPRAGDLLMPDEATSTTIKSQ
mmetsp:Transcript_4624/g.10385  ORF Transcript_4624/g.10385 Transcript_4624/m.10385 type:complete len:139 (+) Transcript_4624:158-574(+)